MTQKTWTAFRPTPTVTGQWAYEEIALEPFDMSRVSVKRFGSSVVIERPADLGRLPMTFASVEEIKQLADMLEQAWASIQSNPDMNMSCASKSYNVRVINRTLEWEYKTTWIYSDYVSATDWSGEAQIARLVHFLREAYKLA